MVDALFHKMINQKFIVLSQEHNIPPEKDIKGKEHCKLYNSFRHSTKNYITFRNRVQDLIQKWMLKYATKVEESMMVDKDTFPKEVNLI